MHMNINRLASIFDHHAHVTSSLLRHDTSRTLHPTGA